MCRNAENTRDRENGGYYDRMFRAAVDASPDVVFITSFNEWGEGTQIEPAVPHEVDTFLCGCANLSLVRSFLAAEARARVLFLA